MVEGVVRYNVSDGYAPHSHHPIAAAAGAATAPAVAAPTVAAPIASAATARCHLHHLWYLHSCPTCHLLITVAAATDANAAAHRCLHPLVVFGLTPHLPFDIYCSPSIIVRCLCPSASSCSCALPIFPSPWFVSVSDKLLAYL